MTIATLPMPIGPACNQTLSGPHLTAARNDHEALATWLAKYTDNHHTLESYRREAERLMNYSYCSQHEYDKIRMQLID